MSKPINVLFLSHFSSLGGAEKHLVSIIENLEDRYRAVLLCQDEGDLSAAAEKAGAKTIFMKMGAWRKLKNFFANQQTIKKIVERCKSENIGMICSNCYRVTPYATIPAMKLNIPSITIIQDFVPIDKLRKFKVFDCDSLIAVSECLKRSFELEFSGNVFCIYNYISRDLLCRAHDDEGNCSQEVNFLESGKVIGMIANIIPAKGHKVFIDAAKIISQEHPEVSFVIVGDVLYEGNADLNSLKAYAEEKGMQGKIIFTGHREDIAEILSSFHMLINPSEKESFGRVVAEAMIMGVPVIATKSGGPEEIIEHNESGVLVDCGDIQGIAFEAGLLLSDESRREKIALKGKIVAEERFSLEKTVKKANDVFDNVLQKVAQL